MTVDEMYLKLEALIREGYGQFQVGIADHIANRMHLDIHLTLIENVDDEIFVGIAYSTTGASYDS